MKKLIDHTGLKDGKFYVDRKRRVARCWVDQNGRAYLDYVDSAEWIAPHGDYRRATDAQELRWRRARERKRGENA
jgi:hypothetical protein